MAFNLNPNLNRLKKDFNWVPPYFDVTLADKYGPHDNISLHHSITRPTAFCKRQQSTFYCGELYVDYASQSGKSILNDYDCKKLERVLKNDIYFRMLRLEDFVKRSFAIQEIGQTNKQQVLTRYTTMGKRSSLEEVVDPEVRDKQQASNYLQMLIAGAILFRRYFERISISYEFETQIRLNRDITKMYKRLTHFKDVLIPLI